MCAHSYTCVISSAIITKSISAKMPIALSAFLTSVMRLPPLAGKTALSHQVALPLLDNRLDLASYASGLSPPAAPRTLGKQKPNQHCAGRSRCIACHIYSGFLLCRSLCTSLLLVGCKHFLNVGPGDSPQASNLAAFKFSVSQPLSNGKDSDR